MLMLSVDIVKDINVVLILGDLTLCLSKMSVEHAGMKKKPEMMMPSQDSSVDQSM